MDEDNNLLLGIKRSLIKQGFIVEIAVSNEEALSKIERFFQDLQSLENPPTQWIFNNQTF